MKSFLSSPRFLAALVAVLLVLSFIPTSNGPALEMIFYKAGAGRMHEAAENHLHQQREQALKGFLLVSALKVGLAVLKSSEVGFILNVKVGDLAVAVYDYVNFAWKVLLAAVAYYYIAEYFMTLASVVNVWFLWAALVSIMVWLLLVDLRPRNLRMRSVTARTGIAASIMALLLYIGLPLSLIGAGWVSHNITGEPIKEANRLYEDMSETMPSLVDDKDPEEKAAASSGISTSRVTVPVPYDGTDPSLTIREGPEESGTSVLAAIVSGEKLRELKDYLQQRSRALASAVLRQTAAYIFNIALFPLLMLVGLYFTSKYFMNLASIK